MGVSTQLKLPFPELIDMADGPDAFNKMSAAVEGYFYDRTLPTGVTRAPTYNWGSGTTLPTSTALRVGDTYTQSGKLMIFTGGTSWAEVGRPTYVSSTDPGGPDGAIWFKVP